MNEISNNMAELKKRRSLMRLELLGGVILLFVILNFLLGGRVLTGQNIVSIIRHAVFPSFVAWGMSFIFTAGIIDLSVGATIVLAANIGAVAAMEWGLGYWGLLIMAMLTAVICEQLSVRCSVILKIPSWISGLGMALVFESIISVYGSIRSVTQGNNACTLKSYRIFGTTPVMALMWIVGFIIAYFLLNRTNVGINIQAIGGNSTVAKQMGINEKKTILLGALIGSVFFGMGAVINLSDVSVIYPKSGLASLNTIFKSLAVVLLAQGFTKIIDMSAGILAGSIIISTLFNILTLIGVPSGTGQEMLLGIVVIFCGIISSIKTKEAVK
jgi:ribose transport system permease protein